MGTFFFAMQHKPNPEQIAEALKVAERIVALAPTNPADRVEGIEYVGSTALLNVPDEPKLDRAWFVNRAKEILSAFGKMKQGDTVQAMGQYQLANALNAAARRRRALTVESVTARESEEQVQPDGSTKKVVVFRFRGYRPLYKF